MKGVILQPGYLPWLGFFNQMMMADHFVYLDDVQYDRRGWRNRNRIKGSGGPIWLTVPVIQKGKYHQTLRETEIDISRDWAAQHLKSIRHQYGKAAYFEAYFPAISHILEKTFRFLLDLDLELIECLRDILGITTPTSLASECRVENFDKTGRLVDICLNQGITEYISGPLCQNYMDYQQLEKAGIALYLQEYHHPEYTQRFPPFVPFLSTIDLLLNTGPESCEILRDPASLKRVDINAN